MSRSTLNLIFVALLILGALAFPHHQAAQAQQPTLADIIVAAAQDPNAPEFTLLLQAIQAADPSFLSLLTAPDTAVTIFAPTDAAFTLTIQALGLTTEEFLANPENLSAILRYHIIPGLINSEAIISAAGANAFTGTFLDNSLIEYGVLGTNVRVGDANLIQVDITAANGMLHVVDTVLLPPNNRASTIDNAEPVANTIAQAITEFASSNPARFTILLQAIQRADPSILNALGGQFSGGAHPYTVFLPTDAAFERAFAELGINAEQLLANPNMLNSILIYHVAPGRLPSNALASLASRDAVLSSLITQNLYQFDSGASGLTVNEAPITQFDIVTGNGIMHVIEGVLLPPIRD